ncbi:uncharacterized protein PITG_06041 [Phytophthora infestans T30-4]|uniref:Uncharacterized protein n=1 Tax=Phytophthora infestans (strain T30-4) TaxID=403677 RepID=D0N6A5_PHYIT|nr:uncharacterized protein PITG_06041 [Phytophthora infestans T30-4]EEY70596.1 conserved hypothetical protein [Phytophthora infestans T30-4]|eukprot:XP_002998250.1 conserved hypothetical protein [Phytophthora infestans T30-4]
MASGLDKVNLVKEYLLLCSDKSLIETLESPVLLGPLDNIAQNFTPVSVVFVYLRKETLTGNLIPIERLRRALERLLDYYPHLTGRVVMDDKDNAPRIEQLGPSWGMAVPPASAAATSSPSAAPSPRSPTPPASAAGPAVPAAMVDAPAGAVTPPSPVRAPVVPSSPVRASVAPSSPQLIYEITIEGLCGDDVGGDVAADDDGDDSVAAEDVPLQEVRLFNDEDEEDTQRTKRARLRRGDETSDWHPFPLPKAPERHPTTSHRNHYNPDAPWDYANSAGITRLLDVEGESPHRCYLVQWKGRPLQMSWVWMELLDKESTRYMMQNVDKWKASGSEITFMKWYDVHASASEAGTCFMDALRCALYHLGRPNLVTMEMWDKYEKTRPEAIAFGVSREDVTEFWKTLQRQSVPLDYGIMLPNILHESIGSVATLNHFFEALVPDWSQCSPGRA